MNWIQKNYERAFLIAASALAILGSIWIILKASEFKSRFVTEEVVPNNKFDALKTDAVADALKRVANVPQWPANPQMPLFSSTPFVVMNDRPNEPFRMRDPEGAKLRDPVPNVWLVDNGLDYTAIDVLEQDPDRDGYSNLDEFLGETDPNSSLSQPGWDTKLHYVERIEQPLTIRLSSGDNGTCSIAFITTGPDGTEQRRNEFIKVGASSARFEPGRFKIEDVKQETVQRFGSPTQVAVAFMKDANDRKGSVIRLEQGALVPHPTYVAKFAYDLTAESFEVKEGEDFELRKPAGMTITVEEIGADQAVIAYVPEGGNDLTKKVKKLRGTAPSAGKSAPSGSSSEGSSEGGSEGASEDAAEAPAEEASEPSAEGSSEQ